MRKILKWSAAAIGAAIVAIQFVPVDRSNPPAESEGPASAEVSTVLQRACYNCHSNETEWPWYSYVAPASWLVARDVHKGREEMNFSEWNTYSAKRKNKVRGEVWEEVSEGEMPPWFYMPLHPEARLSEAELALLQAWSGDSGEGGRESNEDH